MWLPMSYTFRRHDTYAALARGAYGNILLFNYGFARTTDGAGAGAGTPQWAQWAQAPPPPSPPPPPPSPPPNGTHRLD